MKYVVPKIQIQKVQFQTEFRLAILKYTDSYIEELHMIFKVCLMGIIKK